MPGFKLLIRIHVTPQSLASHASDDDRSKLWNKRWSGIVLHYKVQSDNEVRSIDRRGGREGTESVSGVKEAGSKRGFEKPVKICKFSRSRSRRVGPCSGVRRPVHPKVMPQIHSLVCLSKTVPKGKKARKATRLVKFIRRRGNGAERERAYRHGACGRVMI